jgi:hypothetical protein
MHAFSSAPGHGAPEQPFGIAHVRVVVFVTFARFGAVLGTPQLPPLGGTAAIEYAVETVELIGAHLAVWMFPSSAH